jgi:hypothetical protein
VTTYVLASASGLTFALAFFLALSAAIALMIYILLTQPSPRRSELGLTTTRRTVGASIAAVCGGVVFLGIYFSSLAGFHSVTVADDHIQLESVVPPRSVSLTFEEIAAVSRRPAYKTRWRLEICTHDGHRFESAPGASRPVRDAVIEIDRRRAVARGSGPLAAAASEASCA